MQESSEASKGGSFRKQQRVMRLSDCSCSEGVCIMNGGVIMIAVHLYTERSSVAELQA